MRNTPPSDNVVRQRAIDLFRTRLPRSWRLKWSRTETKAPSDSQVELIAPDGAAVAIRVEARRMMEPRDVSDLPQSPMAGRALLVTSFLSSRTQAALRDANWAFMDLAGNARIALDRPALFIETRGADENPWREERPSRSLKGGTAARIVRALVDFRPPVGVRDLAARADADPGYVSRIVALLEREALVWRTPVKGRRAGPIGRVLWQELLRRWTKDYSLMESHRGKSFLAPRGLAAFEQTLAKGTVRHAVTASLAAYKVAPVAPPRLAACFVDDIDAAATALELTEADVGANVLLFEPFDDIVYSRSTARDGISCAAPSQVVADLLTSSGRAPAEAEALIQWMESNESAWRA